MNFPIAALAGAFVGLIVYFVVTPIGLGVLAGAGLVSVSTGAAALKLVSFAAALAAAGWTTSRASGASS